MARRRFHRLIFLAAGVYNLAWGVLAAVDPQWLFRVAGLEPLSEPAIFACLGMVIGLYGLLYLDVARAPEQGWRVAAIGLAGKVLGPLGWLYLVGSGRWPWSTFVLWLPNDLMWWLPFGLYLHDAWLCRRGADPDRGARAV